MKIVEYIKNEMKKEANQIIKCATKLDSSIKNVIKLFSSTQGKIIITGVGKSGIIGRKIAATLSSTGTTSQFIHSSDALHGDIGVLTKDDILFILSYSGNTSEISTLIPYIKHLGIKIVALTGNKNSVLAKSADITIDCSVESDSELFGLVPTSSTTVMLALGDAIALTLAKKNKLQINDFSKMHPGGTIGKKLLLTVENLMKTGNKIPINFIEAPIKEVIVEMTQKTLGCTVAITQDRKLAGIFTDGDLRRTLVLENWENKKLYEIMQKDPKSIKQKTLAFDALEYMEKNKITALPVVNDGGYVIGIIHIHSILEANIL